MPCRDGGPSEDEYAAKVTRVQDRLNTVTSLLCSLLARIERNDAADSGTHVDDLPRDVRDWWDGHKEFDRKRELAEKAEREAKKLTLKNQINNLKKQLKDIE